MTALMRAQRAIPVAESLELLLQGCERREPWSTADGLSGSRFERVVIDGTPMVVKYISVDDDWIMRATGDLGRRQLTLLSSGVLTALPACIDHAIVGCAPLAYRQWASGACAPVARRVDSADPLRERADLP